MILYFCLGSDPRYCELKGFSSLPRLISAVFLSSNPFMHVFQYFRSGFWCLPAALEKHSICKCRRRFIKALWHSSVSRIKLYFYWLTDIPWAGKQWDSDCLRENLSAMLSTLGNRDWALMLPWVLENESDSQWKKAIWEVSYISVCSQELCDTGNRSIHSLNFDSAAEICPYKPYPKSKRVIYSPQSLNHWVLWSCLRNN